MRNHVRFFAPQPANRSSFRLFLVLACVLLGTLAPRPAAAQTTGSISGFVVDGSGNRVSGATITSTAGPSTGRSTSSAFDGSYLLSGLNQGSYTFTARKSGFSDATRTATVISGTTTRLDFTLRAGGGTSGGILQGVVRRSGTSVAISGARVQITDGARTLTATTDATGSYRFANLPTGAYNMLVTRTGFVQQQRSGLTVREGSTVQADFSLLVRTADLAIVQGTVSDAAGRRIAGALVKLSRGVSAGQSDTTDANGIYQIPSVVPDTYDVQATASGFTTGLRAGVAVGAAQTVTVNFQLSGASTSGGTLEGTVRDTNGDPVPGARVETTAGPNIGRFAVTDASGFYRITGLAAGSYSVRTTATGFTALTRQTTLTAGQTTTLDLTLTASTGGTNGAISGTVTQAGGGPVDAVTVRISAGAGIGQSTTTDASGNYVLANLPAGTYELTFSKTGFQNAVIGGIVVTAGQTTDVDTTLQGGGTSGATLTGLVRDNGTSALLSGALVEVLLNGTAVTSGTTDANGRYTLSGVAPGTYVVRFSRSGYDTRDVTAITLTSGQTRTLDTRLSASVIQPGTISGIVRDAAARPLPNATIQLTGTSGTRTVLTDANGAFSFTGVAPGSGYSVSASSPGLVTSTQSNISVASGQTLTLTFNLTTGTGQGSVSGVVRTSTGLALSGATVIVVQGPTVGQSATTGTDGRYSFTSISPGTYVFEARATGYRSYRQQVTVSPGGLASLSFYLPRL